MGLVVRSTGFCLNSAVGAAERGINTAERSTEEAPPTSTFWTNKEMEMNYVTCQTLVKGQTIRLVLWYWQTCTAPPLTASHYSCCFSCNFAPVAISLMEMPLLDESKRLNRVSESKTTKQHN